MRPRLRTFFRVACVAGLFCSSLSSPADLFGQAPQPPSQASVVQPAPGAPATAKPIPAIADEPRQIDPAQFLDPKLRTPATIQFEAASLEDVAEWVRTTTGWNVVIDAQSFAESGVLSIDPIDESIDNVPLYLLLDRLSRYGVTWRSDNNMITFLRAGDARGIVSTQFNVADLFDKKMKSEDLIDSIQATVDPFSWENADGTGAIVLGDVLFVRQYGRNNRRIACLLSALRTPSRRVWIDDTVLHTALRESLDKAVSINIQQKSLTTVAADLAKLTGTVIRLDRPGLKQQSISDRTPVTLQIQNQKLRVVLDLLTRQHGLGWQIRDGVIWITSAAVVETEAVTATYDVRDLCRDMDESIALQDAVEQQAAPDSWDVGGTAIRFPLPGIMVVRQTEVCHDEVLKLLEAYRTALRSSKPRVDEATDPEKVITSYYRMPTAVADELFVALPELVAAGQWKTEQSPNLPGKIRMLRSWDQIVVAKQNTKEAGSDRFPPVAVPYSVLIVEQRRKFQIEIGELLRKIEAGETEQFFDNNAGGMGGMGGGRGRAGGGFGGGMFSIPSR